MKSKTDLPKFLKEKREKADLSQGDVSEKLGYSTPQFVSNWERGISTPPFNVMRELAIMYKINPDELFNVILENKMESVAKEMSRKFYGKK